VHREGIAINDKKVRRILKENGLISMPQKHRSRRATAPSKAFGKPRKICEGSLAGHKSAKKITFQTIGYGKTKPVASNDTEAGRAQNSKGRSADNTVILRITKRISLF